ncbi:MAG: hypothetical protein ACREOX_05430, partial [Stenotrophomonas sp.]
MAATLVIVGAPGATAFTVNVWLTDPAGSTDALPAWFATITQEPARMKVSAPPLVMVHTAVALLLKVTGRPELAVADRVGWVPKS